LKSSWFRWNLKHVLVAVAALAMMFAVLGVGEAVGASVLGTAFIAPIVRAQSGRRIKAAAWVASLHPIYLLISLHVTWITAWYVLGHRPRISFDDPKFIGAAVDCPYIATAILLISLPFSFLGFIVLNMIDLCSTRPMNREVEPRIIDKAAILLRSLVWIAGFLILRIDRFKVFDWFLD